MMEEERHENEILYELSVYFGERDIIIAVLHRKYLPHLCVSAAINVKYAYI